MDDDAKVLLRLSSDTVAVYRALVVKAVDISELSSDGRSLDDMVRSAARRYMDERSIGERLG